MKYGVVNYPIKIIDEEIINALADIEIHHEEDKRIVLVECVMNYTELPEECVLEIGYLKRKFKLMLSTQLQQNLESINLNLCLSEQKI